ncbi:MAG TPA: YhdH/YhfP family quinone oxidoreductase [Bdellovibrionales bacterium]|nr:YhdH/YhfP family quinone oxidoreductase [Bdellovibrionales bacterium]
MNPFWALRIHGPENAHYAKLQRLTLDELTPGEVVIETHYSSVNYKDALAALDKAPIMKRYPLNGGIDGAGVVISSIDERFKPGDKVIATGHSIGENFDGGYSEVMRVSADSLVKLPEGLSLRESMIIGTAGFTAALAMERMLNNGQTKEHGPILVTGASGGVGSFAVALFAQAGFEVLAVSGKHDAIKYLKKLGAKEVLPPNELGLGHRPLERARFGGVVDSVGGKLLAQALAHTHLWGNVASIGLAESSELQTTVMPFILRGVSLLGASSNNTPIKMRQDLWRRLAGPWKPKQLEDILTRTVELKDLMLAFDDLIHRKIHGRVLVRIRRDE